MRRYTVLDIQKGDDEINKELNYIVEKISSLLRSEILSILLVGGFGRGEGGVVQENGSFRAVNDYDILVIVKNSKSFMKKHGKKIKEINEQINNALKVKQVDLAFVDYWKLYIPSYSVARYENKHGYKLLYGKKPLLFASIPNFLIPKIEGTKYFRTRGSGLLIAALLLEGYGDFSKKERQELTFLEISKAFLAIGDSFLIQIRKYHYSYHERRKRIMKYFDRYKPFEKLLLEKYLYYNENKLRPDFSYINHDFLLEEWSIAANSIIISFLRYESIRLKNQYKSLLDYHNYICKSWKKRLIKYFFKEENFNFSKQRIQCYFLLKSCLEGRKYISTHMDLFSQLFQLKENKNINLSELIINFLKSWHPCGIISKL